MIINLKKELSKIQQRNNFLPIKNLAFKKETDSHLEIFLMLINDKKFCDKVNEFVTNIGDYEKYTSLLSYTLFKYDTILSENTISYYNDVIHENCADLKNNLFLYARVDENGDFVKFDNETYQKNSYYYIINKVYSCIDINDSESKCYQYVQQQLYNIFENNYSYDELVSNYNHILDNLELIEVKPYAYLNGLIYSGLTTNCYQFLESEEKMKEKLLRVEEFFASVINSDIIPENLKDELIKNEFRLLKICLIYLLCEKRKTHCQMLEIKLNLVGQDFPEDYEEEYIKFLCKNIKNMDELITFYHYELEQGIMLILENSAFINTCNDRCVSPIIENYEFKINKIKEKMARS